MVPYSKVCRKCDAAEKRGGESEEHECPNNFEGRSKIMEASVILNMVEDAFYNQFFIIDVIVSKDDIPMQAVLKHPYELSRSQILKSSKIKLDE